MEKNSQKVQTLDLSNRKEWMRFEKRVQLPGFCSHEYCISLSHTVNSSIYLWFIDQPDGGAAGVYCLRSLRPGLCDIYSPYGYGGIYTWGNPPANFNVIFRNWCIESGFITYYLLGQPQTQKMLNDILNYRTVYVLNLRKTEAELWKNLSSSHRTEIRKASEVSGFKIRQIGADETENFVELYAETYQRVNASKVYNFSIETLKGFLQMERMICLGAFVDGKLKSVISILHNDIWAEYFISASHGDFKNCTKALLWEAITTLKNMGLSDFNLGGGIRQGDSLEKFKERFGGERNTLSLFKGIVQENVYTDICNEMNLNPADNSYFPIYWKNEQS